MKNVDQNRRDDGSLKQLLAALGKPKFSFPCHRIGTSRLPIRATAENIERDFVVFLGSDNTYGCHLEHPFPALVQRSTNFQVINFGCVGARNDLFVQNNEMLEVCKRASLVFIEIMGAEAISNRLYRVDARNNQLIVRVSKYLKALYEEVDFSGVFSVSELLSVLAQKSEEKFYFVKLELHLAWVARLRALVRMVGAPVILLWIADHDPYHAETGGTLFRDPLFVDRTMIEALRHEVVDIVEVVASKRELYVGRSDTTPEIPNLPFGSLGPEYHDRVATELAPIVRTVMSTVSLSPFSIQTPTNTLTA